MANENRISATLESKGINDVIGTVALIRSKLESALLFNLTEEDRKRLARMGDKTLPFANMALTYADQSLTLCTPTWAYQKHIKTFALAEGLHELLQPLTNAGNDTYTIAGVEAYDATWFFIPTFLEQAIRNVAGTQAVNTDLKKRFPGGPRKRFEEAKSQSSLKNSVECN